VCLVAALCCGVAFFGEVFAGKNRPLLEINFRRCSCSMEGPGFFGWWVWRLISSHCFTDAFLPSSLYTVMVHHTHIAHSSKVLVSKLFLSSLSPTCFIPMYLLLCILERNLPQAHARVLPLTNLMVYAPELAAQNTLSHTHTRAHTHKHTH